jgi:hypothetical protein
VYCLGVNTNDGGGGRESVGLVDVNVNVAEG